MKKAVIETGGKQYFVEEGTVLYVEKLDANAGDKVVFDKVLMANGITGRPYVKSAKVTAEVIKHGKQKKIIVFKYNPKKKYRKKQGHRQPYTKIEIKKIMLMLGCKNIDDLHKLPVILSSELLVFKKQMTELLKNKG